MSGPCFPSETPLNLIIHQNSNHLNWIVQMALFCPARLQLLFLEPAAAAFASARISHAARGTLVNTRLVCTKHLHFTCFSSVLDLEPTPDLGLCAGFWFGYFGSPNLVYPALVAVSYVPCFVKEVWPIWVHTITFAYFDKIGKLGSSQIYTKAPKILMWV